jgi:hypothetical protein
LYSLQPITDMIVAKQQEGLRGARREQS